MLLHSRNLNDGEGTGGSGASTHTLDELVSRARSMRLYEGPDGAGLPQVIKERLAVFLDHALKESGGNPQPYAVYCRVFSLPPGCQVKEPQEIVEYDYHYDLGPNQMLNLENYRYLDDHQRIELGVTRQKEFPDNRNAQWLCWPEEIVELFRTIQGEDIGTYHDYLVIQAIRYVSEGR
jgi:hypothetical protein